MKRLLLGYHKKFRIDVSGQLWRVLIGNERSVASGEQGYENR